MGLTALIKSFSAFPTENRDETQAGNERTCVGKSRKSEAVEEKVLVFLFLGCCFLKLLDTGKREKGDSEEGNKGTAVENSEGERT